MVTKYTKYKLKDMIRQRNNEQTHKTIGVNVLHSIAYHVTISFIQTHRLARLKCQSTPLTKLPHLTAHELGDQSIRDMCI